MKLRIPLLLLIILLLGGALFLWARPQGAPREGASISPVLVDILAPANGLSVVQGDALPVLAQAWSTSPLAAAELWVDNQLVAEQSIAGSEEPAQFAWDWEAGSPGIHTLVVRARDSQGEEGVSQTVLLNVNAAGLTQVLAAAGQTLEELSTQHGAAPQEAAAWNPGLSPDQPLEADQPVTLPAGQDGSAAPPPPEAAGAGPIIHWELAPTTSVDQSYCYQSTGGGWQRVPQEDFAFLPGEKWLQSLLPGQQQLTLMLECWGWEGGILKYLGRGETQLDKAQMPDEVIISAEGFQASGQTITYAGEPSNDWQMPAPFALRKAQSVAECMSHYSSGNLLAGLVCESLLNGPVKQYDVFVWEWQPVQLCWPTENCKWLEHADGYIFYEMDDQFSYVLNSRVIDNGAQKVLAIPLGWGGTCFGVSAYAESLTGEVVNSEMATFCGESVKPQEVILKPVDWLSTYNEWINLDCDVGSPQYTPAGTQITGGMHVLSPGNCIRQGEASAAVKFDLDILKSLGAIQQVNLRFKSVGLNYQLDSWVATNLKPLCLSRLGRAKQDWTGLSSGHYIANDNLLWREQYFAPYKSFSMAVGANSIDVTSAVLSWIKNPANNHGFILAPNYADAYNQGVFYTGGERLVCYSLLDHVELQVRYYAPGN
ncbi:MAG: hypothetical protein KIS85_00985 [Anaerolineales bacterium]|nr:hypothetical protein [Anaerolineales bacterium]